MSLAIFLLFTLFAPDNNNNNNYLYKFKSRGSQQINPSGFFLERPPLQSFQIFTIL